jgi:predicted PurR-regulated permease PerM
MNITTLLIVQEVSEKINTVDWTLTGVLVVAVGALAGIVFTEFRSKSKDLTEQHKSYIELIQQTTDAINKISNIIEVQNEKIDNRLENLRKDLENLKQAIISELNKK